jgi:hypothetical protein
VNIEATEEIIHSSASKIVYEERSSITLSEWCEAFITIFKYEMEVAVDPVEAEEKIDLTKMFTEDKK